jgi:hypothetical protein
VFLFTFYRSNIYIVAPRPRNRKELFNLRHAMLRNVVERIFGVVKRRFRILLLPPEYSMEIQARIPPALCLVHNIIRVHDPNDMMEYRDLNVSDERFTTDTGNLANGPPTEQARTRASLRRDQIAGEMWEDYNRERVRRGEQAIVERLP